MGKGGVVCVLYSMFCCWQPEGRWSGIQKKKPLQRLAKNHASYPYEYKRERWCLPGRQHLLLSSIDQQIHVPKATHQFQVTRCRKAWYPGAVRTNHFYLHQQPASGCFQTQQRQQHGGGFETPTTQRAEQRQQSIRVGVRHGFTSSTRINEIA